MNLTHLVAFSTFVGGAVFTRTVMLTDIAWATVGGVLTTLITTAGGIAIALINRPARRARRDAGESRDQEEDEDADT